MNDESRRLLAIMFSDIVGYSRMMGADEKLALKLVEEHNALMLPLIEKHRGKALKFIGDAILSSFEVASDAVRCSVAIQKAFQERNSKENESRRIVVRIGIHVGEVAQKDGDIFGDGVNIAARVEPLAQPGGICVTQTVYQLVQSQKEIKMESLGKRKLKNISDPMILYRVPTGAEVGPASRAGRSNPRWPLAAAGLFLAASIAAVIAHERASAKIQRAEKSSFVLAVAPFYGPDADSAKDGVAMQALINEKVNELFGPEDGVSVLAAGTGAAPRSRQEAKALADQLGATALIWGQVIKLDGETDIQPYLTDSSASGSYWAQNSPDATQSQVEGTDQIAIHRMKTTQAAALALLAAAHFYGSRSPLKALALLQKVDPQDADTSSAAGYLYITLKQLDDADRMFAQAIKFDPKSPRAYNGLATVLRLRGKLNEAGAQYRKALALKSDYPAPYLNLGMIDEAQGRGDDAEAKYRQVLSLNSDSAMARFRLANLIEKRGRYADAAAEYKKLIGGAAKPRYVAYDALFCELDLERAGDAVGASAWVKTFLSKVGGTEGDDKQWPLPFFHFLNGDLDMDQLVKSADSADPDLARKGQCDLNYYLGMWSLLYKKDPAAARAYFQKTIATGLETRMEYQKAKAELSRLSGKAS